MFCRIQSVSILGIKLLEKKHCLRKLPSTNRNCEQSQILKYKLAGLKFKQVKSPSENSIGFLIVKFKKSVLDVRDNCQIVILKYSWCL